MFDNRYGWHYCVNKMCYLTEVLLLLPNLCIVRCLSMFDNLDGWHYCVKVTKYQQKIVMGKLMDAMNFEFFKKIKKIFLNNNTQEV